MHQELLADGVLGHAEVVGDLLDGTPLLCGHVIRARQLEAAQVDGTGRMSNREEARYQCDCRRSDRICVGAWIRLSAMLLPAGSNVEKIETRRLAFTAINGQQA